MFQAFYCEKYNAICFKKTLKQTDLNNYDLFRFRRSKYHWRTTTRLKRLEIIKQKEECPYGFEVTDPTEDCQIQLIAHDWGDVDAIRGYTSRQMTRVSDGKIIYPTNPTLVGFNIGLCKK